MLYFNNIITYYGQNNNKLWQNIIKPKPITHENISGLSAQFESAPQAGAKESAVLTWLWLVWVDVLFVLFAVLLVSFGVVLASCVLSFGLVGVCLVSNLGTLPFVTLPPMPYWCGAILSA